MSDKVACGSVGGAHLKAMSVTNEGELRLLALRMMITDYYLYYCG